MKTEALIIKNGFVVDPKNQIFEVKDIAIKDGKIVESVDPESAKNIDAENRMVVAGGVEIHAHLATPKVDSGRVLRCDQSRMDPYTYSDICRAGVWASVPPTFMTGYKYSQMGYTFVTEAASAGLVARHTHEELGEIQPHDKVMFPLFGNNQLIMEYAREKEYEKLAAFVAWMLSATKGWTIKAVNPAGVCDWSWGGNVESLDEQIACFDVTARDTVISLLEGAERLTLPHSLHLHANMLGRPGNADITIETMELASNRPETKRESGYNLHMTHIQFHSYGGDSFITFQSGSEPVAKYLKAHKNVSCDLGQIVFSDTTTMTADGPWEWILRGISGSRWVNDDIEVECGGGVVPYVFKKSSRVNAIQWGIGLEIALTVNDPWRVIPSTDHPNAGTFINYPFIAAWLMSKKARENVLKDIRSSAKKRMDLPAIDTEWTLQDYITSTRAGPARILGLPNKGHLGIGADADIAIYSLQPKEDYSKNPEQLIRSLSQAWLTLKGGQIVQKEGAMIATPKGSTYWIDAAVEPELAKEVDKDIREKFMNAYTISYENYPVSKRYLHRSASVKLAASS
ncbi:MAG: formylmethanofuran dehydrogenase subunit A [Candidatus Thorarchaeota archaeon]